MRLRPRSRLPWLIAAALAVGAVLACEGEEWTGNRNPATLDSSPIARLRPTPVPPPMFEGEAAIVARDAGGSGAYEFDPPAFFVGAREPLVLTLQSETEAHTFTVEDLDIDEQIPAGGANEVELTFTQSGSFSFACSIHPEMTGVVHVR